jgi:alkylation response protein AidB-like acyl-CoA dehydrogenase
MNAADKGMSLGLRALNRLASAPLLDRIGIRERAERLIYSASKNGFRAAGVAGRTFAPRRRLDEPARQATGARADLFDLTPTDEQQMMREAIGDFAIERLRPAASDANEASEPPQGLLEQANELGVTMLGVPGELDGAFEERSAVTSALVAEQLARGDMGLAVAMLAPAAVGTAIGLWGDADQQSTYLPDFAGSSPPAAALALIEPGPLFDPAKLETRARADGDGYVLDGQKALVPRAADAELFVIAAELDGRGPALFVVEAKDSGLAVEPEPAMGLRAAGTGRLHLDRIKVESGSLLGDADPVTYAECVRLARLGWCALAVGTSQAVLDYVIPYVNERVAFGEPISHRQAVAFDVANIAIELDGMRLATYRAAGRADQGLDNAREVALARRLATRYGMKIGSDGVQLLGGHGYTKEHPVERWYRDLRAAGLMEGAVVV